MRDAIKPDWAVNVQLPDASRFDETRLEPPCRETRPVVTGLLVDTPCWHQTAQFSPDKTAQLGVDLFYAIQLHVTFFCSMLDLAYLSSRVLSLHAKQVLLYDGSLTNHKARPSVEASCSVVLHLG